MSAGIPFIKGHGTENDFVVLPSYDDDLAPELVRALCDRRAGIGADGVLRVVRDRDPSVVRDRDPSVVRDRDPSVVRDKDPSVVRHGGTFFMDYRNADGSIAETCGNGIRVFARYLVSAGLAPAGELDIDTRSGLRRVTVPADGGDITVDMGQAVRLDDAEVSVGSSSWKAVGYSMGNPHLVVLDAGPIDELDLRDAPVVDPASAFPDGVNVELLEPVGERHLRMRVHERGVGETRSCGTGACAAAVAAMDAAGERSSYVVDVPGGRLEVEWREDGAVLMTGPAVLVASGEVDPEFIRSSDR